MFVSTPKVRPFIQNENADNTGFKKPGALKPSGSQILRTPFRDRSVNSVSPTSKYNSNLNMKKKQQEPVLKKAEIKKIVVEKSEDLYDNDYASYREIEDGLQDIYPSKRLDVYALLNAYVSRGSPKYVPEENDDMDIFEVPTNRMEFRCSVSSPFEVDDVPLPIFNY